MLKHVSLEDTQVTKRARDTKRDPSVSNKHIASCAQCCTYSASEIDSVSPAESVATLFSYSRTT